MNSEIEASSFARIGPSFLRYFRSPGTQDVPSSFVSEVAIPIKKD